MIPPSFFRRGEGVVFLLLVFWYMPHQPIEGDEPGDHKEQHDGIHANNSEL